MTNDLARGRDQERKAIVTYLRHAAACHAINTTVRDPLVDILDLYASKIEGGWHCCPAVPPRAAEHKGEDT